MEVFPASPLRSQSPICLCYQEGEPHPHSSPVWRSPLSQCLSMSRHTPSQSLGWFFRIISLTQPSTPKLRATLCQLAANSATTSSSTSLMSGVDKISGRARVPEVVLESADTAFILQGTSVRLVSLRGCNRFSSFGERGELSSVDA